VLCRLTFKPLMRSRGSDSAQMPLLCGEEPDKWDVGMG